MQPRQGHEKLRELEELMEQAGLTYSCDPYLAFIYDICLRQPISPGFLDDTFDLGAGDAFEISDEENEIKDHKPPAGRKPKAKAAPGAGGLPVALEGDTKDVPEALTKYKKAVLNKRTILKAVKDRLDAEKCTTCGTLAL